MSKVLLLNSSTSVALLFLKLGVAFILTPIIVKALGNYDYGIYEIVLALIGYMGLLEFGLQPAVTRFVARYSASGNTEELRRVFSTAISLSVLVGTLISLMLVIWAFEDARGLVPEDGNNTKYIYFLLIISCQVLVSFPGNVVLCIHQGHQRHSLINLIIAINTVIGSTIIYLLLTNGYGLLALALGNAVGISVKFIILGWMLWQTSFGSYRLRLSDFNFKVLRELMTFGGKSFALGITSSFSKRVSPLLIGGFFGPAMVVFYVIPFNLIGHLINIISAATLSFMPYFSNLHALGDIQKIREIFLFSSRYMVGLSLCGFISAAFLGPAFLRIWIGPEYAEVGASIICIVSIWAGFKNLNPFHGRILTGMDLHGVLVKLRMVEALIYLGASLVLMNILGIKGVALSVLMAAFIVEPIILRLVCRQINHRVSQYLKQVVLPSVLPALILTIFFWLVLSEVNLSGYGILVGVGVIGCLVYLLTFMLTVVSSEERRWGTNALRKLVTLVLKPEQGKA